ncbi:MAG: hypothetical protein GXO42_02770 [bacterium]|nr:hypothetical protein [bacterium]
MALEGISFDVPTALPAALIIVGTVLALYILQLQKVNSYYYALKYYDLLTYGNLLVIHCTDVPNLQQCISSVLLGKVRFTVLSLEQLSRLQAVVAQVCGNSSVYTVVPIYSAFRGERLVVLCERL